MGNIYSGKKTEDSGNSFDRQVYLLSGIILALQARTRTLTAQDIMDESSISIHYYIFEARF